MGKPFSERQSAFILSPDFTVDRYFAAFPDDGDRPIESFFRHRRRQGVGGVSALREREDDPQVSWDKAEGDFHWTDLLAPLDTLQTIWKRASSSQDHARIVIRSPEPVPICFISDWHFGSWGTDLRKFAVTTKKLLDHGIRVAVLGDMLQMAIKLRGVLEVSDNAIPPRYQMLALESWAGDIAHLILWSTYDNHSVQREEDAVGFSQYADIFRAKTIYHNGIGHIDLAIDADDGSGGETYRIATAHRFRGNTADNPLGGQIKYMQREGIDRELAVAGDSHRPALKVYPEGPLTRIALNCGTYQTNSGYAKRFFSLYTHDWMPTVLFYPKEHKMIAFPSLDDYLEVAT